jgi:NAD(P)-dependent dehydrogenase (short-subunit alcohol dehydrogenase family)
MPRGYRHDRRRRGPLRRPHRDRTRARPALGEAADIARAVAALVQPGLAFATGTAVHVDGALAVPRF